MEGRATRDRLEVNEETWAWVQILDQGEPDGLRERLDDLRGFAHLFIGYSKHIANDVSDALPHIAYLNKQLVDNLENGLRRIVDTNIGRHNWIMRDGHLCPISEKEEA